MQILIKFQICFAALEFKHSNPKKIYEQNQIFYNLFTSSEGCIQVYTLCRIQEGTHLTYTCFALTACPSPSCIVASSTALTLTQEIEEGMS